MQREDTVPAPPPRRSNSISAMIQDSFSNEIQYVQKHGIVSLLDGMVARLLVDRPEKPIRSLIDHVRGRFAASVAVAATLAQVCCLLGQAAGVPNVDLSCLTSPSSGEQQFVSWMANTPPEGDLQQSVVVISGFRTTPRMTDTGCVTPDGRSPGARRRKSTRHGGQSPVAQERRRSAFGRSQQGWDECDPLQPPPGLFGDDGATLQRRSLALLAAGAGSVVSGSSSPCEQQQVAGGGAAGAAVVRRRVDVPSPSPNELPRCVSEVESTGAGGGTAQQQPLRVMMSFCQADTGELMTQTFLAQSPVVDSEDDSDGEDVKRQKSVKKKKGFGMKKLPAGPSGSDEGSVSGAAIAAEEIAQCHLEDCDMLDLHQLSLPEAPPALFDLGAKLTSLDVCQNRIRELPSAIKNLVSLVYLSVKSNQLTKLPDEICQLPELQDFYADHNELTELPKDFGKLSKLRTVGLDWNDLDAFPKQLCEVEELDLLYIVENPRVSRLPTCEEMSKWKATEVQIDNMPSLVQQWREAKEGGQAPPGVKIDWNSVFPDLICDQLYLGSLRSAQQVRIYTDLHITHLASIGRELTVVLAPGMEQLQLNVDDMPGVDLTPHFDAAHQFIDLALEKKEGVLVHCFKGQSRSATVVCTYLMRKRRMTRDQAIAEVKKYRPCINPNPGFMDVMARYEKTLGITAE